MSVTLCWCGDGAFRHAPDGPPILIHPQFEWSETPDGMPKYIGMQFSVDVASLARSLGLNGPEEIGAGDRFPLACKASLSREQERT